MHGIRKRIHYVYSMKLILIYSLAVIPFTCCSQEFYVGARSASLAHASSSLGDSQSIFNNPGSLGYVEEESVSSGYATLFEVEGWNSVFASLNKKIATGYAGIGIFKFGDELMNTSFISLGFGHKLGIGSLGASVTYQQFFIEGYGQRNFVRIDFGGVVNLSEQITISGGIKNLSQSKISSKTGEYYPTQLFIGLCYSPSESVKIFGQLDNTLDFQEIYKFSMEYKLFPLSLRIGVQSKPVLVALGLGIAIKRFDVDFAFQSSNMLGHNQNINISYRYSK